MIAEDPHVAAARNGDIGERRNTGRLGLGRLHLFAHQNHVDLGGLEAGDDQILFENGQLLELEADGVEVPGPGFAYLIEGDATTSAARSG